MKKIFIYVFLCFALLITTGCGCSRLGEKNSSFYKKDLSFDFDKMDTISADIKKAIEKGLEDANPVKMTNGHFRIDRTNYSYTYEEGNAKTKVGFYEFTIDARPEEKSSVVNFKGNITIDFQSTVDGSEYGGNYFIKNNNHKVIEFEISNLGKTLYDEKTGVLTIVIPEFKETGTITQTSQKTTTTESGYVDEEKPVTNNWALDDVWDNVEISFTPHAE